MDRIISGWFKLPFLISVQYSWAQQILSSIGLALMLLAITSCANGALAQSSQSPGMAEMGCAGGFQYEAVDISSKDDTVHIEEVLEHYQSGLFAKYHDQLVIDDPLDLERPRRAYQQIASKVGVLFVTILQHFYHSPNVHLSVSFECLDYVPYDSSTLGFITTSSYNYSAAASLPTAPPLHPISGWTLAPATPAPPLQPVWGVIPPTDFTPTNNVLFSTIAPTWMNPSPSHGGGGSGGGGGSPFPQINIHDYAIVKYEPGPQGWEFDLFSGGKLTWTGHWGQAYVEFEIDLDLRVKKDFKITNDPSVSLHIRF